MKELENMLEKDDLIEKDMTEMQKTILIAVRLSFGRCCQDSSKVTE